MTNKKRTNLLENATEEMLQIVNKKTMEAREGTIQGLTREKKEILKSHMGSASSKIDFNKVREWWKYDKDENEE
ncbi:hypothetical protein [Bacillus sp. T33-2]|uniref:hypothetical protein n=1 Tax=Bacillus sp. T33-2 TaxID=2054168 RepID=UPI000C76413A|nr:hypothetical protein [Bacillus sp. T33-2]PLR99485.1 hypothetical protein CVD19_00040 [Bacillus sp. T33-2]